MARYLGSACNTNRKSSFRFLASLPPDLEAEASLPEKKGSTLSLDLLIDYVHYMVENHEEDDKAMARDKKNYYQETPKRIPNKVDVYKPFYPMECQAFIDDSLQNKKMGVD